MLEKYNSEYLKSISQSEFVSIWIDFKTKYYKNRDYLLTTNQTHDVVIFTEVEKRFIVVTAYDYLLKYVRNYFMTEFRRSWGFEIYPLQISHKIARVELKEYILHHKVINISLVEEEYLIMFLMTFIINQKSQNNFKERWSESLCIEFIVFNEYLYEKLVLRID